MRASTQVGLLVALTGITACSDATSTPEGAAKQFISASVSGNADKIYKVLAPETQQQLKKLAERAATQMGTGQKLRPADLLAASLDRPTHSLRRIEVVSQDASRARVKLIDVQEKVSEFLDLVAVGGKWRVKLDLSGVASRAAPKPATSPATSQPATQPTTQPSTSQPAAAGQPDAQPATKDQ